MENEKGKKITLRINPDLYQKLKEESERQNRSMSNLILTISRDYVNNPDARK